MPTETHPSRAQDRLPARAPRAPKSTDQTPDTDQPDDSTADLADEFEAGSIEGGEIAGADVTLTTFDDGSEASDEEERFVEHRAADENDEIENEDVDVDVDEDEDESD